MTCKRLLVIVVSSILALIMLGGMAYLQVRTRSERIRESNEAWYATRTALAIYGPPTPKPTKPWTPLTPLPRATLPAQKLALLSMRGSESYGYFIVEGQVKNISGSSLDNVVAVVTVYDASKRFITYDEALIDYTPVLPGQTSPFSVYVDYNPAIEWYDIEFKYLLGGTIPYRDDRPGSRTVPTPTRRASTPRPTNTRVMGTPTPIPPSPTPRPTATPTTPALGTRANPVPRAQSHLAPTGWQIVVLDFNPHAWPVVQAENMFNDPPRPGNRMVMIRVGVSNVSVERGLNMMGDAWFRLEGSYRVVYAPFHEESRCGVIPDQLLDKVLPGEYAEGNICFQIPGDETGLRLLYEVGWQDYIYFAVE